MKDLLVLFASKSDESTYSKILKVLDKNKVNYNFKLASAHKTPDDVNEILKEDYSVIVAGAGLAAALPGVVAAKSIRPVIGVPCLGNYQGLDALLSIMQMPPGVPVLTVGVDEGKVAAQAAINILKGQTRIVLIGDKSNRAFRKAEDIFKKFEIECTYSDEIADDAINVNFVYFDERIEKQNQLVIYCPLLLDKDDKAEASLNLLKHSDHGLWVGLNNGVNAALAAIEILNMDDSYKEQLVNFRSEQADKVKKHNK